MTLLGLLLGMTALWVVQRRTGNAAWTDLGWTACVALTHVSLALTSGGDPRRCALLATQACLWGLRLGTHLYLQRLLPHHAEEGRYQKLRQEWGDKTQRNLLLFFLAQGLLAWLMVLPFGPAYRNPSPVLGFWEWLGTGVFAVGLIGVALADAQLAEFRRRTAKGGRPSSSSPLGSETKTQTRGVCRSGLWSWSRHPNYFFESVLWFGWGVFALGSPGGLLALTSPSLLLFLVLRVTGIPPTEEQSLRSKGEEYRQYQRETSVFVPWPPRRRKS